MDTAYVSNLQEITRENTQWMKVLHTTSRGQIVIMSIPPFMDIGEEIHKKSFQFTYIVSGTGIAIINDKELNLNEGSCVFIPAGTRHNIENTSKTPLKLYTIYSPPVHEAYEEQTLK
jgi:mannose-6-phosphate isomerase-like protein (cupin superfamily)